MNENIGTAAAKRRISLERAYAAPVEDVWELWTTKEGIESWWGPDGFQVTVQQLELRAGGALVYTMTATDPPQIEFMKKANMPLSTQTRATFTQVEAPRRLAYDTVTDFIPGVEPYLVSTQLDLEPTAEGTKLTLTFDAMHSEQWSNMAEQGWRMELGKLANALISRSNKQA